MLGQACAQGQGVEVFHQAEQRADAARLQPHQRFVQLHVHAENLLEVVAGHAKQGGRAMRVGIVRPLVAVEHGHIAKPHARLHVGQRDLLARERGRTHAHRALGDRCPFGGRVAAGDDEVAILESLDVGASEYVVTQGR